MRQALERLGNESPTILAALAAAWYVFGGLPVPDEILADLGDNAEAVAALLVWLHARRSVNGPVTAHRDAHRDV